MQTWLPAQQAELLGPQPLAGGDHPFRRLGERHMLGKAIIGIMRAAGTMQIAGVGDVDLEAEGQFNTFAHGPS